MPEETMQAPAHAADAAEQLAQLQTALEQARTLARKYGSAADRAEHLYRREQSKAALRVAGRNADERAAAVHEFELGPEAQEDGRAVAAAMGLGETQDVLTVGELRWLRDRASRLADEWSATAYDRRNRVSAWMTVASMAKSEAELAGTPRLREAG